MLEEKQVLGDEFVSTDQEYVHEPLGSPILVSLNLRPSMSLSGSRFEMNGFSVDVSSVPLGDEIIAYFIESPESGVSVEQIVEDLDVELYVTTVNENRKQATSL